MEGELQKERVIDINLNINLNHNQESIEKPGIHMPERKQKVKLTISVAQLAYICKMYSDLGIIRNKNISDLIRCIIGNFSTPKAQEISFDSFKTKYYNTDYSTKRSVQDLIIKQLNYLRKELAGKS